MRIQYNAPVILTFSLLAVGIYWLTLKLMPGLTHQFFLLRPHPSWANPLDWFRLVSYPLGHSDWEHLFGNLIFILLLGPILEEKYGGFNMLLMILLTALVTGLLNVFFFSAAILGASGIVFMLIVLASTANLRQRSIPLTFILVFCFFLGSEVMDGFKADNISQMGHIMGGLAGACYGFMIKKG